MGNSGDDIIASWLCVKLPGYVQWLCGVIQTESWWRPSCESWFEDSEVEQGKALLYAHTTNCFLGCNMRRSYVEDSRCMWLHPARAHRGLWWAAILVKPTSVCTGGFHYRTLPLPFLLLLRLLLLPP